VAADAGKLKAQAQGAYAEILDQADFGRFFRSYVPFSAKDHGNVLGSGSGKYRRPQAKYQENTGGTVFSGGC